VRSGESDIEETLDGARPTAAGGRQPSSPGPGASPQSRGYPAGFRDFQHFQAYAGRFRDRMRELYPDVEMGFQGSSVTGRNSETGALFDEGRVSDYDVAISGDSVNATARDGGVSFRSDQVSTGPLTERDLARLGLDDIVDDASAEAGRDIHLMIFRTMEEAAGRKPTIRVWF
jgi:hypothetical protein